MQAAKRPAKPKRSAISRSSRTPPSDDRCPPLRGVNIQRLFGSQRALKTVEDFTEFEQRTAYFDGDIVTATKKGVNPLVRGSQVDFMADFQEMLDFPPAPKLDVFGKLDPAKATPAEMRGQEVFFGKGQCASCHQPPYYTDNLMHDLQTERFFKPEMINYAMEVGDGKIKTFPLRGIKDNPPYLHDQRLLTLDDTVEFFNLVLGDETDRRGEAGSGGVPACALTSLETEGESELTARGSLRASGPRCFNQSGKIGDVKWIPISQELEFPTANSRAK